MIDKKDVLLVIDKCKKISKEEGCTFNQSLEAYKIVINKCKKISKEEGCTFDQSLEAYKIAVNKEIISELEDINTSFNFIKNIYRSTMEGKL